MTIFSLNSLSDYRKSQEIIHTPNKASKEVFASNVVKLNKKGQGSMSTQKQRLKRDSQVIGVSSSSTFKPMDFIETGYILSNLFFNQNNLNKCI